MRHWAIGAWLLAFAGCAHAPQSVNTVAPPSIEAGMAWGGWHTLRAEHRVAIEAQTADGHIEQRSLRGVIAVSRPGSFRLRALGPGGITLFDVLSVDGRVEVLAALRDPQGTVLEKILSALATDLAAAYDLEPRPAERSVRIEDRALVVTEPERSVRLEAFRPVHGGSAPGRMVVEDRVGNFRLTIDAEQSELDVPLDAELFRSRRP